MESGGLCRVAARYVRSRDRPCQLRDCILFHSGSGPVTPRAVQALVVVVSLDIFEDFSTSFDLGGEDLIAGKALTLERTEERFGVGIIITISYPTHAEIGPNNVQRFA